MNYNKLKGMMREKNYSQKRLAEKLGISEQSLNSKLNGKTQFLILEVIIIINILRIENPSLIFFENSIPNKQLEIS